MTHAPAARTPPVAPKQGEVYWTRLDPVVGHEQAKTRPCAVLSADAFNRHRGTVVIVPLTTSMQPTHTPLLMATPSMGEHTKARIEHIRSVDKSRLGRRMGVLSAADLQTIASALAAVLAWDEIKGRA